MLKVEKLKNKIPVYDLTVQGTSNFFANGLLVHNCAEIVEYTDPTQTAVCNLASISLPAYIDGKKGKRTYNFSKLEETVRTLTENLDKIVDIEYYPVETARNSNLKHRPLGIGIQGLADVFAMMRYPWESAEARELNKQIAETIYYASLKTSCELAKAKGAYSSFAGSPASQGILQFDMWGVVPTAGRYDWEGLKRDIMQYGLRNSLSIALMPTASTSQVLGNTECFEPITSNIYKRATLSGEFIQINKYLVEDLMELGLWNENLRQKIIIANGSIQEIQEIPENLKQLYKTVWEISQRTIIDLAADRGAYICQSQSLNLYFKDANFAKLSSAYMYGWKRGLKTIVYYTRTMAAREAIKFTVDKELEKQVASQQVTEKAEETGMEDIACSLDNPDACIACGS